jgi:hypothetical protein
MNKFENCGTKELVNYLNQRIEALRIENTRLLDQVERLSMNIESYDAQIISNENINYYNFISNFNKSLKTE